MTKRLYVTAALFALFVTGGVAQTNAGKRTIRVDVNYTGSGVVDAGHKIYVALWDTTDLQNAQPVAVQSLDSKKGTVTFSDVQKVPAYVSTAYDPTGAWAGKSALVLVGENDRPDEVAYITQHFATFVPVDDFQIIRFGHDIYRWRIFRGEGYTP